MVAIIAGEQFWLWCTIDEEGEVLDQLAQRRSRQGEKCSFVHRAGYGYP
jgi:transposase-like protein